MYTAFEQSLDAGNAAACIKNGDGVPENTADCHLTKVGDLVLAYPFSIAVKRGLSENALAALVVSILPY